MTTITYTNTYQKKSSPMGFLVFIMLIVAFASVVIISDHATNRHGADARRIRTCLDKNGPYQIWNAGDVFYRICQLDDGRFGIQAIRKGGKISDVYHEITAFIKGKGTIDELIAYLQRLKATQWSGPLP